jgi:hypothetical protein
MPIEHVRLPIVHGDLPLYVPPWLYPQFSRVRRKMVFWLQLRNLIHCFDRDEVAASVIYFGDSVSLRVSRDDRDTRSLAEMVTARLSKKMQVVSIYGSSYDIRVFDAFVRALVEMKHRPRVIILPLNLRTFSPQWRLNPALQFDEQMRTVEDFAAGSVRSVRSADKVPRSFEEFEATPVEYPNTSMTRIGQYYDLVRMRARTTEEREYRWRHLFVFHYMHPLHSDHPMLLLVKETLEQIERIGAFAIVYTVPVNYQAARKLIGDDFLRSIRQQVDLLHSLVTEMEHRGKARFLDLATMFGPDSFFHEHYTTEHLNERGRQMLADLLAQATLELS